MTQADFAYIPVNFTFTAANPTFQTGFNIDQALVGGWMGGYLLITVRSVDSDSHRIFINSKELLGWDIPLPPANSDAWFTYMDRIDPGVLQAGGNSIRITRSGNDDFAVRDVVVHWREAA